MRFPLFVAALLAAGALVGSPVAAEEATTAAGGTTAGGTAQGVAGQGAAAAGAATQGGVQGDCPEGQVQSAGGDCAPGMPTNTDMPGTQHQQELLKGQQGVEGGQGTQQ
jgi:hypothetical protein